MESVTTNPNSYPRVTYSDPKVTYSYIKVT